VDESDRLQWVRDQLDQAIRRLTETAPKQIEWIGSLGVPIHSADELALEFDRFAEIAGQLRAAYPISDQTLDLLRTLDGLLGAMSGPEKADLWSFEALGADPRWATVRFLAEEVLLSWESDGMSVSPD
jgi:succinate dehydrogenase/fumarate reductase flavoprotein subunit